MEENSMRALTHPPLSFCGETVHEADLSLIRQVIERYPGLSRTELANTLCHHRRHGGQPKTVWLYPLRRDARQRLCQEG
jgi:hypothetical protein